VRTKELRALSREKLAGELENARLELMKLKAKKALGTVEKPTLVRNARKNVARILTVMREPARNSKKKVKSAR
jgi:large subunit ribosomal protein L29